MSQILLILNIIVCAIIVVLILLQGKGAGLGNAWGGSGEAFQTRRGVEKFIVQATVFFIVCLVIISVMFLPFIRNHVIKF